MTKYFLKRLGYMLGVLAFLSLLVFLIYNLFPADKAADTARQELQVNPYLSYAERYTFWSRKYGTDGGVLLRYLRWLGVYPFTDPLTGGRGDFNGILQGNFGTSVTQGKGVIEVMKEPLFNTVTLNVMATVLGLLATVPLGIFCARRQGKTADTVVQVGTVVGYSLPVFIVAILFVWLFAVKLNLFPVSGMSSVGQSYTGFRAVLDRLYHFALPLITMTFCSLGGMTRYVRSSMIDALQMDCIRTARAKGLSESAVVYRHAFRNALLPITTLVIGWFLSIFSGSIMVENVFGLNGVGKVYFEALQSSDTEVALALQMFYIAVALVGNLLTDLAYGLIDPRIRIGG